MFYLCDSCSHVIALSLPRGARAGCARRRQQPRPCCTQPRALPLRPRRRNICVRRRRRVRSPTTICKQIYCDCEHCLFAELTHSLTHSLTCLMRLEHILPMRATRTVRLVHRARPLCTAHSCLHAMFTLFYKCTRPQVRRAGHWPTDLRWCRRLRCAFRSRS